ncbi:MAG: SRPBCC family protein [Trueperaceae bacterium]|nr:SRPBCC family protein [Trueperaceae bacterium]
MLELEHSINIAAPVDEVYRFVTDPQNATKWRIGLIEAKQVSPGDMGVGSKIEEKVRVLGRELTSKLEITDYVPNKKRSFRIQLGPLPIVLHESYQSTPEGTQLQVTGTTELKGPQRMLAAPVLGQVKRQLEQELANIKAHFSA